MIHPKIQYLQQFVDPKDPTTKYRIVANLGSGTYGDVFKAVNRENNDLVAIKKLKIDPKEDIRSVCAEIQTLKELHHRNIVEFYGSHLKNMKLWIVMEFCGGNSMQDIYLALARPFAEDCIAFVTRETLRGLAFMHKKGKIHRDIKGANILLTESGEVKVADFGVAAQINSNISKRNTLIGTPYWMAPEVAAVNSGSSGYDSKCDVWAVGITAIEYAELQPPLFELAPMKALKILENKNYKPPTLKKSGNWSPKFSSFLKSTLVKNVRRRPDSEALLTHEFVANPSLSTNQTIQLLAIHRGIDYQNYQQQQAAGKGKLAQVQQPQGGPLNPVVQSQQQPQHQARPQNQAAGAFENQSESGQLLPAYQNRPKEHVTGKIIYNTNNININKSDNTSKAAPIVRPAHQLRMQNKIDENRRPSNEFLDPEINSNDQSIEVVMNQIQSNLSLADRQNGAGHGYPQNGNKKNERHQDYSPDGRTSYYDNEILDDNCPNNRHMDDGSYHQLLNNNRSKRPAPQPPIIAPPLPPRPRSDVHIDDEDDEENEASQSSLTNTLGQPLPPRPPPPKISSSLPNQVNPTSISTSPSPNNNQQQQQKHGGLSREPSTKNAHVSNPPGTPALPSNNTNNANPGPDQQALRSLSQQYFGMPATPKVVMGAGFALIFESCPLKINCTATWIHPKTRYQYILFGTNDGIYYLNLANTADEEMKLLVERRCIWLTVIRDTMMSLSGKIPHLYSHNLELLMRNQDHQITNKIQNKILPKRSQSSTKIPDTRGCYIANIIRNPADGAKYLCAAVEKQIIVFQWFNNRSTFVEVKRVEVPCMPSPVLTFDLVIASDKTLPLVCLGVYATNDPLKYQMHTINLNEDTNENWFSLPPGNPLSVVKVLQLEYNLLLICFPDHATIVTHSGRVQRICSEDLNFGVDVDSIICLKDSILVFHTHGLRGIGFDGSITQDINDKNKIYRLLGNDRNCVVEARPTIDPMSPSNIYLLAGHTDT